MAGATCVLSATGASRSELDRRIDAGFRHIWFDVEVDWTDAGIAAIRKAPRPAAKPGAARPAGGHNAPLYAAIPLEWWYDLMFDGGASGRPRFAWTPGVDGQWVERVGNARIYRGAHVWARLTAAADGPAGVAAAEALPRRTLPFSLVAVRARSQVALTRALEAPSLTALRVEPDVPLTRAAALSAYRTGKFWEFDLDQLFLSRTDNQAVASMTEGVASVHCAPSPAPTRVAMMELLTTNEPRLVGIFEKLTKTLRHVRWERLRLFSAGRDARCVRATARLAGIDATREHFDYVEPLLHSALQFTKGSGGVLVPRVPNVGMSGIAG